MNGRRECKPQAGSRGGAIPAGACAVALVLSALAGCATHDEYKQAFNESRALHRNTHTVQLPPTQARQAVVSTFIKNGFNITQAQPDLVTATRTIQDSQDAELSYVVNATAAIAPKDDADSLVSLSANQQTVLHRATHDWFHLLWVVPLFPYATEYQTVVRSESTVDDPKFLRKLLLGRRQSRRFGQRSQGCTGDACSRPRIGDGSAFCRDRAGRY